MRSAIQGYRLKGEEYELINEYRSQPLGLTLKVKGKLLAFYREDTGEKLLIPDELREALDQERQRADKLAAKLLELGIEPEL